MNVLDKHCAGSAASIAPVSGCDGASPFVVASPDKVGAWQSRGADSPAAPVGVQVPPRWVPAADGLNLALPAAFNRSSRAMAAAVSAPSW